MICTLHNTIKSLVRFSTVQNKLLVPFKIIQYVINRTTVNKTVFLKHNKKKQIFLKEIKENHNGL